MSAARTKTTSPVAHIRKPVAHIWPSFGQMWESRTLVLTIILLLALPAALAAQSITGTVTNDTTGKPAAGCAVTLVDPMAGMAEVATAKSDAQGRFSFTPPPAKGPRLVRAERSGVNYFKMLPPGRNTVALSVYDAASSVEGISGAADVLRLQSSNGRLDATELFAITNASKPPRTLAAASTFDFVLPEGAAIDVAEAQAPNGQPISVPTKPAAQKNHYSFNFALKPGETRLQVSYHMPYSGKIAFAPQLTRDFEHYVVVMPSAIKFTPADAQQFRTMNNQPGSNIQVIVGARAGQKIAYEIAGEGVIREAAPEAAANEGGGPAAGGGAMEENRPGGGLGKPIDSPDPLEKFRWPLLAGLMLALIGGGIWTRERTLAADFAAAPAQPAAPASRPPAAAPAPNLALLTALKDELFALEMEHQQGKVTAEQYAASRAALEQTLQRALGRRG